MKTVNQMKKADLTTMTVLHGRQNIAAKQLHSEMDLHHDTRWLGFKGAFNTDLVISRHYRTNIYSKLHSIMGNTAEYNQSEIGIIQ